MITKEKIKQYFSHNSSFIFSVPAVMWQVLFLYIPFFIVVYASLRKTYTSSLFEWTFKHYLAVFHYEYIHIIFRSASIACGVALLCLIFAYPMAYYLALKVN